MSNPQVTLQITLTAEAFASTAVQKAIAVLLGGSAVVETHASSKAEEAEAKKPAATRKRRSKAEIEAERKAAEAAAADDDEDDDDDEGDDDDDDEGDDDDDDGEDDDEGDEPAITLKQLRELFNAKAKANREVNGPKLKAILKKYQATAVSDLDEDDYEAVYAAVKKLKG